MTAIRFDQAEIAHTFRDGSVLLHMRYAPDRAVLGDGYGVRAAYRDACRQARQMTRYGNTISQDYFIWRSEQRKAEQRETMTFA